MARFVLSASRPDGSGNAGCCSLSQPMAFRSLVSNERPGTAQQLINSVSSGVNHGFVHLWHLARKRLELLVAWCLVLRPLTRLRHILNDEAFID